MSWLAIFVGIYAAIGVLGWHMTSPKAVLRRYYRRKAREDRASDMILRDELYRANIERQRECAPHPTDDTQDRERSR